MYKIVSAALLSATACIAVPAFAQASAAPAAKPAAASPAAATPAGAQMTPAQVTAFNQAVTDFTAGQTAQQAGDNAGAAAKYEAALPAIRTAVQVQPGNLDNVNFLANALYADAAAQAALNKVDAFIALFEESAPHWRKIVAAKPTDAASRNILAGILTQLGNARLTKGDKAGADPFYVEAIGLARKSVAEKGDATNKNLLLGALIGGSQTSADAKVKEEAVTMGKAMLADGSIDAINKPSIQTMTGAAAAPAPAK